MTANLEQLRATLDFVSAPGSSGFNAVAFPGAVGYRLGRGPEGSVAVMTPPDADPQPAVSLRRLTLAPRVLCSIQGPDGDTVEADVGLIDFRDDSVDLVDHFLRVASTLVESLGPEPGPRAVSRAMQRLLKLFESSIPPRGSVVGVWGELLTAVMSSDPVAMVDAWHAQVDDRFDFAAEGSRLEIKTTTRVNRVHRFNLPQLLLVDGAEQHVVSVMTTEAQPGTSVGDLVDELSALVPVPQQLKLLEQVATILGPDWPQTAGRTFDRDSGLAGLAIFEAAIVPRVEPGAPAVLEVALTVDLTGTPESDRGSLGRAAGLVRLLAEMTYPAEHRAGPELRFSIQGREGTRTMETGRH